MPQPPPALHALVIDDDPFMRALLDDMLRAAGVAAVHGAADGRAGLAAFDDAARRPDLVLVDLQLPGQDGFQVMEALAARSYSGGVIVVSGQQDHVLNSARQMGRFYQLQVLEVLAKPVDAEALAQALGRLV